MNSAESDPDNSIDRRIELKRHRPQILRILDKHGLRNPRLFGSVLHGTSRAGSDFDILVDPDDHATLLDLAKAQQELEDELGVLVDLVPLWIYQAASGMKSSLSRDLYESTLSGC
jgi:predicted nucleotidyltransferase